MDSCGLNPAEIMSCGLHCYHVLNGYGVQPVSLNRYRFELRCYKPLGPLILTVSCPAPAPRVSQMKRDWNVARTPCSIPGPYTRTLLGSGAPATRKQNGLPGTWSPDTTNGDTDKHRSPSKNNDPHTQIYIYISVVYKKYDKDSWTKAVS